MPLVLSFDTETDGLVDNHQPASHPSQPYLVELGCVLFDLDTGREWQVINLVVRPEPDQRPIPAGATSVHGISTERATEVGVPLVVACAVLSNLAKLAPVSVAHNHSFDLLVLGAAFHRIGRPLPALNSRCTQNLATAIMNLPPSERMLRAGFNKPKPPKLSELYTYLFGEELVGAHGALTDARACGRAYRELVIRGLVPGAEIDDGSRMTDG
jgi:DNA polymerase III subunit epsilon